MVKERLSSLDILRGADMFLLLFLGPVLRSFCKVAPEGTAWLSTQLQHVKWEGFVLWDIIMPLFLFLSGYLDGQGNIAMEIEALARKARVDGLHLAFKE